MKRLKHATAGGNAPVTDMEGTREHTPSQLPAVATPVFLSDADAERLRARVLALLSLADEVGIHTVTITMHQVSESTAFQAFPEGVPVRHELPSRVYGSWDVKLGGHIVHLFTGNTVIDDINAETTVLSTIETGLKCPACSIGTRCSSEYICSSCAGGFPMFNHARPPEMQGRAVPITPPWPTKVREV